MNGYESFILDFPETDEPAVFEIMWQGDHLLLWLDQWPECWTLDAARCSDHVVDKIVVPTRTLSGH
ncbi:hypothetical protein ACFQL7_26885 [Halocatena marina]|uniref:Uncharacterized protein n=1 Tax=Halocatena marina TaxID=2934937 RepID=A0ABD5YUM4_9EURY